MTQFRIDRIRFTWKGVWTQSTFYTKDDIVQYGGKSYVCLVGHTSTTQTSTTVNGVTTNTGFYSDLYQVNTTVTPNVPNPYWQLWFDGYTYQGNWKNGTLYNLGDIVTYDSFVYICNTSHTSVASTLPLAITSASGDGTYVTYGFSTQLVQPFKVGSSITVSGLTPSSYNGTFIVVNSTANSVTISSSVVTTSTINLNSTVVSVVGSGAQPGIQLGLEYNQSYWTSYAITDNWQSNWNLNTRYQVGNVVKYNGSTYRCTSAHISAPSTAFISITGVSPSSPSTGSVTLSFAPQVVAPFAVGATITVSGVGVGYNGSWVVTACTTSTVVFANSSVAAFTNGKVSGPSLLGLEYNQANWTIEVLTDKWTADWTISTRYKLGDIVRYGGFVYRCTVGHLSANTLALGLENDSSSWQSVVVGIEYKSVWLANVRYKINDIVKFGANAYICNTYHTSSATFDATKWSIYAPGYEYKNQWNASTLYVPGDVVKFHGYSWVCIAATTNADPSTSPAYWTFSTSGYFTSGDWVSGVNYYPGDVVRRNGQLYVAISDSFSYDPSVVGNSAYWTLIVSGSYWANRWTVGVVYAVGDVVTYYATSYRCLQTNTAAVGNSPYADTAHAYWNVYVQGDHFEVIQTPGDITTFTTTQVALPIGTVGMVLKSNGVQPVWSQFGQINDIYYVSPGGTDAPNYGQTLNAPFATIAYACNYVLKGAYFQNTAYLLTQNKQWLIAEMYNWMLYQKTQNAAPFTSSSVFDPQKTQRDAEYIIDGIIYDITRGGNSQTVAAALSYFQPGTNSFYNSAVSTEMPFFKAALAQLASLISNALQNSSPSTSYQGLMNASTASVTVTGASGTGTTVTLTFNTLANQPFTVGETIIVNGILPSGYNGTYVVSAVSNTSVSYSNVTTTAWVSGGSVTGSNITQYINLNYILEANGLATVTSLLGIITTALTNVSTAGIPAANTGVTSTIFVKDGTYNEILPISIPENCAIVGDELRNTIVQPATKVINFTGSIANQALTITALTSTILTAQSITATTAGLLGTTGTGGVVTVASTAGLAVGNIFTSTGNTLSLGGLADNTYYVGSIISATQLTLSSTYNNALAGTYITFTTATITGTTFTGYNNISVGQWVSANTMYYPTQITGQLSGITGGPGVYSVNLSQTVSSVAMTASYYTGNMFYVRNGAGIRNMTLSGLTGTLGPLNSYLTQRPTAGAYVSLDPGLGPYDTSVWIFRKSPYVQNVTTFGTGCVGLKIDGTLHNGGNKSIVANDFTQVLSDGIGAWCTGSGSLTELVSVFSYYCHAGYLSEQGGKIRATNGNSSYGKYGVVAETYDALEVPITGTVFNRYYQAQVQSAFAGQANNKILLLEFSNMGQNYTTASYSFAGAGTLASVVQDEFRDNGIFETHLTGTTLGLGGSGYGSAGSQAQAGTATSITVATADTGSISTYLGMRIIIVSGTGVGQYGYITAYNTVTKVISVSAESTGQAGWDHVIPGTPIVSTLDTTTQYAIEPRPLFSAPAYTATAGTLPNLGVWTSTTYGNGYFVAIEVGGLSAYSTDGVNWSGGGTLGPAITWTNLAYGNGYFVAIGNGTQSVSYSNNNGTSWNTSAAMPVSASWTKVAYGGGRFIAITSGGTTTAISTNGTTWTSGGSLPSTATWSGIAYGSIGVWVAVANGGTTAAYSTDNGVTWTASNGLPSSQNWVGVTWGNGRFVAVAGGVLGTSTSTAAAYSFDGKTWYAGTLPSSQNWVNVKYGQGLFMALATTTTVSATSQDGLVWTQRAVPTSTYWNDLAFGNPSISSTITNTWVAVSGYSLLLANYTANILAGAQAKGRIVTSGGTITLVKMWEPGSGYRSTPTLLVTDPNLALNVNSAAATTICRLGTGVLAQPTWLNRGQNYQTSTTTVTITGDGAADILQGPTNLIVTGITQAPTPGAGMLISGNGLQYNIVLITPLGGTTYQFQLSINLDNAVAPVHGTAVSIRVKYSQARLTGHDFLYIGTGNFSDTNYPNVNTSTALQNQQIQFNGGGRVFVVSTDQDGNFKVGNLFGVQQATGIVTVNASLFNLNGVSALSLGGVSVGQNAVVITQFSTDSYFVANSDAIIPTQKAIKTYVGRAISLGGSNAATGTAIAGTVGVGNASNYTATIFSSVQGGTIYMGRTGTATVNKVNFTGSGGGAPTGVDGQMLAMAFFHHGFGGSQF